MKHLRNIRRIDNEINRTHAWLVQVQRGNRNVIKMFSDSVFGGKHKALQAATTFHTQLLAEVPDYEYQVWLRT